MRLIITGALNHLVWPMTEYFDRDMHTVALLGTMSTDGVKGVHASQYNIPMNHAHAQKVYQTGKYDAVLFLCALGNENAEMGLGTLLDGLALSLQMAVQTGVKQFVLITDQSVFGYGQEMQEDEVPIPDTPEGVMVKAAEDCLLLTETGEMSKLVVRVTNLYAHGAEGTLFERARLALAQNSMLWVNGAADEPCDFLHTKDLAMFLSSALEERMDGVVHLAYGVPMDYAQVMKLLSATYPKLKYALSEKKAHQNVLKVERARQMLDWVPSQDWTTQLDVLLNDPTAPKRESAVRRFFRKCKLRLHRVVPLLELLVGAGLMQWMVELGQVYASFRAVDFRLIFTMLIGMAHGTAYGAAAAFLACASYVMNWIADGNSAWMLLYNVDNWWPFAIYFISGAMFGYISSKQSAKAKFAQKEIAQEHEAEQFLQTIYQEACMSRDALQEQVLRYRDSYGRIYAIVSELDFFQPAQIFFSALKVMEDTLKNKSVAIYTMSKQSSFARLAMCSQSLNDRLQKSLDLTKYPLLEAAVNEGRIFANRELADGYPAYLIPLVQERQPFALVALWDVSFEQQSLYYQNLFSVVAGLAQSALVRASHFYNALSGDLYIEDTRIMASDVFEETLQTYRDMQEKRAMEYLLLRIERGSLSIRELDEKMQRNHCIRTTDLIGLTKDGTCYALLLQSTEQSYPLIQRRFAAAKIECSLVKEGELV
ncbi:MAG: hypothetical protein RR085_01530 [Clostridia bacterium]